MILRILKWIRRRFHWEHYLSSKNLSYHKKLDINTDDYVECSYGCRDIIAHVDIYLCKTSYCDKTKVDVDTRKILNQCEKDLVKIAVKETIHKLKIKKANYYELVNQDRELEDYSLDKKELNHYYCSSCGELQEMI